MKNLFLITFVLIFHQSFSQINFNANTTVPSYNGDFLYGSNLGWYGGNWKDENLAEIAAGNPAKNVSGAGVKTLRPTLPEHFLETWGYNIRIGAFSFYNSLGIKDNTVFLEGPSAAHRDYNKYDGCNYPTNIFAHLYDPIWDGGANGTPVNDNNYYALYVYKTVMLYKNYVKFWEIWNEPDYDAGANGWKPSGVAGNWFDKNPSPCEMPNLYAPVFYYNRMLRISYEVIKSIDPTAFVTTGGLGYPGFLDAVLRNTDNPVDGSVNSTYPNKGGAFFDVLSYHEYPMYSSSVKNNRNSDAAANDVVGPKSAFQNVLSKYGYNGSTYPNKLWICTESNVPRKAIGEFIGGEEVQKNFLIKALVQFQKNDIKQFYVFTIGEGADISTNNPNGLMGLYQNLNIKSPFTQVLTSGGIAYKTTSDILSGYKYDDAKTKSLSLNTDVDGGAFKNNSGKYVYVLWAITKTDKSENASAIYSFPAAANVLSQLNRREWNYSSSPSTSQLSSKNISLTGSPSFFFDGSVTPDPIPNPVPNPGPLATEDDNEIIKFKLFPNPSSKKVVASYELTKNEEVSIEVIDTKGKIVNKVIENSKQFPGVQTIEISLNHLKEGLYFCKFIIGDKIFTKKIIKID